MGSIIFKSSLIIASLGLLSRLVGLIRDRILASRFGASDILDVYYASFNLPDLIFNLLVVGAVSSAFIPVFIEQRSKNENEAWKLASNFLNILLLFVIGAVTLIFLFAPGLAGLIAPGFSSPKKDLTTLFTRVMLLSPLIFSVSIIIGSVLQSFNKFFAFSLAPIMYNAGIIVGAVFLEPKFGPLGLAEGVVLGAFLHLFVQIPSVLKVGFKWERILDFRSSAMKKIFKLMVPRTIGLAAMQINWIVLTAIATTVSAGSVAVFNFANNLQYVPIALVGISVAVASFPTLSEEALKDGRKEFSRRVADTLKNILFIIVPLSALFIYLREDIVRIVFGAGKFGIKDINLTSQILGLFGMGIFAQSIIPFLSRSFYAIQNTKIPVMTAIISVAVNIFLAFLLLEDFFVLALPLAFSISGILNAFLLVIFLRKKLEGFKLSSFIGYFAKILMMSGIMLFVILWADSFILNLFNKSFWESLLHSLILSAVGALTFATLFYTLKRSLKI